MRILSTTIMDGRVIELTAEEWRDFSNLARALEGKTEAEAHWAFNIRSEYSVDSEVDFYGAFGAIFAFAEANYRVNEFRTLIGRMDKFLELRDKRKSQLAERG